MGAAYSVGGESYTESQAAILRQLAKTPLILAKLDGYARRSIDLLESREVVETDDDNATITEKGRAVVAKLEGKGNGETKPTKKSRVAARSAVEPTRREPSSKPSELSARRRPPKSPPPTGVVDFVGLRAALDAQYASDIAALERVQAIHAAVAG